MTRLPSAKPLGLGNDYSYRERDDGIQVVRHYYRASKEFLFERIDKTSRVVREQCALTYAVDHHDDWVACAIGPYRLFDADGRIDEAGNRFEDNSYECVKFADDGSVSAAGRKNAEGCWVGLFSLKTYSTTKYMMGDGKGTDTPLTADMFVKRLNHLQELDDLHTIRNNGIVNTAAPTEKENLFARAIRKSLTIF